MNSGAVRPDSGAIYRRLALAVCTSQQEVAMKPRAVVLSVMLVLALLAAPVPSHGQQPGKVYRIGFLGSAAPAPTNQTPQQCPIKGGTGWLAMVEGLREYGYLPDQNLLIECRWAEGRAERAPALAAELVSLTPDLIVACCASASLRAVMQATSTIPIVMLNISDPVGQGLVASLAHPGGNVTGLTDTIGSQHVGKQFQLLKEAVPKASRVAVLRYLRPGVSPDPWRVEEEPARALGLTLQVYGVRTPEELEGAFAAMTEARSEALFVEDWGFLTVNRQRIVDLAAQSRLPAVYSGSDFVQAGGLMSYWVYYPPIWQRVGFYVDKILHGANPADLPVEEPTKFELVINLKTAKALGLSIPETLLATADEVIQ
jgi:putative ABC transport system substrate-binding protein